MLKLGLPFFTARQTVRNRLLQFRHHFPFTRYYNPSRSRYNQFKSFSTNSRDNNRHIQHQQNVRPLMTKYRMKPQNEFSNHLPSSNTAHNMRRSVVNKGLFTKPLKHQSFFTKCLKIFSILGISIASAMYWAHTYQIDDDSLGTLLYGDFSDPLLFQRYIHERNVAPLLYDAGNLGTVFSAQIFDRQKDTYNHNEYHKFILRHLCIAQVLLTLSNETLSVINSPEQQQLYQSSSHYTSTIKVFNPLNNQQEEISPRQELAYHVDQLISIHKEMSELGSLCGWLYLNPFDKVTQSLKDTVIANFKRENQQNDNNHSSDENLVHMFLAEHAAKLYWYDILLKMRLKIINNYLIWLNSITIDNGLYYKEQCCQDVYTQHIDPTQFKQQFEILNRANNDLSVTRNSETYHFRQNSFNDTGFVQEPYTEPEIDNSFTIKPFAECYKDVFYSFKHLFGAHFDQEIHYSTPPLVTLNNQTSVLNSINVTQFVDQDTYHMILHLLLNPRIVEDISHLKNDLSDQKLIVLNSQSLPSDELASLTPPNINHVIDRSKIQSIQTLPPMQTVHRGIIDLEGQSSFEKNQERFHQTGKEIPLAYIYYTPSSKVPYKTYEL